MEKDRWLPLTEYAIEAGVSISTLRRKIKAKTIEFKLNKGKYYLCSDGAKPVVVESNTKVFPNQSTDRPVAIKVEPVQAVPVVVDSRLADAELRWKALEARVNGLAKKLEFLGEQNSELNMLVKVFEEKLDASL